MQFEIDSVQSLAFVYFVWKYWFVKYNLPFQTLEPAVAALYQNRALCFQKLGRWNEVLADSEQALKLLESSGVSSVKALYLQGTAYLNLKRSVPSHSSWHMQLHTDDNSFQS
jgi:tetratricopeptide (TPR) repeat protein